MQILDNPVWHAMCGPQSHLAQVTGAAGRFDPEVSPFHAVDATPDGWKQLATLAGRDAVFVFGTPGGVPADWTIEATIPCLQYVAGDLPARRGTSFEVLTADDVDEMLALTEATKPGPFRRRTIEMGSYLGYREGGRLVAMAGERVHPAGYTEISAVCTYPEHRRKGLARELTLAVAENIRARGDEAFLHVMTTNDNAIALYRAIGFELRRDDVQVVAARRAT